MLGEIPMWRDALDLRLALFLLVAAPAAGCLAGGEPERAAGLVGASCAPPLFEAIRDAAAPSAELPGVLFETTRNHVDPLVLVDAPEIFPAMADLIASAQSHVFLQTYLWEDDGDATRELLAGIARLAERRRLEAAPTDPPVLVRILIDASELGFGSAPLGVGMSELARRLEALHLDPALVRWEIAGFVHVLLGNLHSKTLVVDGRDAIVTGANPDADHHYDEGQHDAGFRFEGDVAHALAAEHEIAWGQAWQWTCGSRSVDPDSCAVEPRRSGRLPLPARDLGVDPTPCAPLLVVGRPANAEVFSSDLDVSQAHAYLTAIHGAKERIRILSPRLDMPEVLDALADAAKRGVVVEAVVPQGFDDAGELMPGQGGRSVDAIASLYEEASDRGVEHPCRTLQIRWFSRDGRQPVLGTTPQSSHAKYFSVDGEVAIVGSVNQNRQSWSNSREIGVVVGVPEVVEAWDAQLFEPDFARAVPACQPPAH